MKKSKFDLEALRLAAREMGIRHEITEKEIEEFNRMVKGYEKLLEAIGKL
ncbi:MAG: hypothetical protein Q7R47_03570 [Candidatus Diapherotrites archaeon]|nr:hypothetical protein [Candidatus Diapherotrites archaeon]